jgi:hypothetical protein
MSNENNDENRMWKDAPAALCEFVGVDPARKWAQCEKERDEWAALAGQYKRERDEARAQRNALAASLEYIASAGLTARHYEDEAKKMLALVFEKEAAK